MTQVLSCTKEGNVQPESRGSCSHCLRSSQVILHVPEATSHIPRSPHTPQVTPHAPRVTSHTPRVTSHAPQVSSHVLQSPHVSPSPIFSHLSPSPHTCARLLTCDPDVPRHAQVPSHVPVSSHCPHLLTCPRLLTGDLDVLRQAQDPSPSILQLFSEFSLRAWSSPVSGGEWASRVGLSCAVLSANWGACIWGESGQVQWVPHESPLDDLLTATLQMGCALGFL